MANRNKNKTAQWFEKIRLPELLALLGLILYLIQAVVYAHILLPNLDEGSYLYKGFLYATGVYRPFQPYGFWINKMYLSFFIWGWVQAVFAPGLLAPRYAAVFFGIVSLLGVWIVSRRLGNRWLATIAVWVLALNPALIGTYSTARSEVLVICMLTWVLVLCLGEERPVWQIIASAFLTGIMILTRENMVFVLPLLILYVFWQHGRKKGILALITVFVVLLIGHIIYWPGILYLWERWLPASLLHLLGQPRQDLGISFVDSGAPMSWTARLNSLSQAIRIHLIPFIGSIIVLLLWPKRESWKSPAHFRAAVFLALLFFILLIAHAWASIGDNYCVFCLSDYMSFWGYAGLLLVIASIGAWNKRPALLRKAGIILTVLLTTSAIGYALFEEIGTSLLNLPLPRFRGGHLLSGWATLWQVLSNKYHLVYADARGYIPAIAGLIVGILYLLISWIIFHRHAYRKRMYFTSFAAYAFLILGIVLLPLLTWTDEGNICHTNVISSYEQIGAKLASIAPPGTRIYLDGTLTDVPLLYTHSANLLLPQLNDYNSLRIGGNSDLELQNGFWNEQIGLQWRDAANVFVIEENRMSGWKDYLTPNKFEQIPLSPSLFPCSSDANILLFKRK
jgi:Dolichyl-phosphate-mannose-protein mannosyltransferase